MPHTFERTLIEQCAPVLRNVKPANLFRYCPEKGELLQEVITYWNRKLSGTGISILILKRCRKTGAVLIYVYRPSWVARIFRDPKIISFLREEGYPGNQDTAGLLKKLSERLCMASDFPHEIGIFLGYPLEDVIGFIKNKGKNYTYSGYWKSYGDPAAAQKTCRSYIQCMKTCLREYEHGVPVMKLVLPAV